MRYRVTQIMESWEDYLLKIYDTASVRIAHLWFSRRCADIKQSETLLVIANTEVHRSTGASNLAMMQLVLNPNFFFFCVCHKGLLFAPACNHRSDRKPYLFLSAPQEPRKWKNWEKAFDKLIPAVDVQLAFLSTEVLKQPRVAYKS